MELSGGRIRKLCGLSIAGKIVCVDDVVFFRILILYCLVSLNITMQSLAEGTTGGQRTAGYAMLVLADARGCLRLVDLAFWRRHMACRQMDTQKWRCFTHKTTCDIYEQSSASFCLIMIIM